MILYTLEVEGASIKHRAFQGLTLGYLNLCVDCVSLTRQHQHWQHNVSDAVHPLFGSLISTVLPHRVSSRSLTGLARVCDKRLSRAVEVAADSGISSLNLQTKDFKHRSQAPWTAPGQWSKYLADARVNHQADVVDWMTLACQCGLHKFGAYCLQKMLSNHHEVSLSSLPPVCATLIACCYFRPPESMCGGFCR